MSKQSTNESSQRKMKLAEAGVLFVLILGLVITVGVKMTAPDDSPTIASVEPLVNEVSTEALAAQVIEAATPVEPEAVIIPAVVIEPEPTIPQDRYSEATSPSVIYQDGEAAYFSRDYDEAADVFTLYTERMSENAWGHYMLGLSLWKTGELEAAATALDRALEIKPDHIKSLVNLARVNLQLDRPDAALVSIEQALNLDASYPDGYRVLGRVYHELDRRDEAVNAYHQAISLHSNDTWSLNNLGLVYLEMDDADSALAPLARAVTIDADQAVFYNNLGLALERTGHTTQAAEAYVQAVDLNGYAKAEISLARVEAVLDNGGSEGDVLDLMALAASFEPSVQIATESAGNMEVVDQAPGSTTSAVADSVVVITVEPTEVALGGGSQ